MEEFVQKITEFRRRLNRKAELETLIPKTEARRAEVKESIPGLRIDVDAAKFDLNKLENPGFFRRLLGNPEERMAKARNVYREASRKLSEAQLELDALDGQLSRDKAELDSLTGCREEYLRFLEEHPEDSRVPMLTRRLFTQEALNRVEQILTALQNTHPHMATDARRKYVYEGKRKMHFLAQAKEAAEQLLPMLDQLPPETVTVGRYLKYTTDYITGVTSEYGQLDRLNNAIDQIRENRRQLRELLAEAETELNL